MGTWSEGLPQLLPTVCEGRCPDGTTFNSCAHYFMDPCRRVAAPAPTSTRSSRALAPLLLAGAIVAAVMVLR